MSTDFDDDDGSAFFTSGDETPIEDLPGGLIVPPRARMIRDAKGIALWDELVDIEAAYRATGRPAVIFEDSTEEG